MYTGRLLIRFISPRLLRYPSTRIWRPIIASRQSSTQVTGLPPREFKSIGYKVIDPSQLIEEERLPFYNRNHYYPIRIGEVLNDRYQVLAKCGYGTSSTVWLCRDLREGSYRVIKVHINTLKYNRELEIYKHLAGVTEQPGYRSNQHANCVILLKTTLVPARYKRIGMIVKESYYLSDQRIRKVVENADIKCEEFDKELGYTITIV